MDIVKQIKSKMDPDETVKSFASRASVDRAKLTNLLNGHDVDITTTVLVRIADALNCDVCLVSRDTK